MEERLKKFTKLIDAGSYTRAAALLHTSQPALTTAIQKLERELKSDLLVRGARPLTMTPSGQIAYKHGRELLLQQDNLWADLRELDERKQPLALGCIDSIADVVVQGGMLEILERDSAVSLHVQNSVILLDQLAKGDLDLLAIARQPNLPAALESQVLGEERFALVCSKDTEETYIQALAQRRLPNFLAYNPGSTTELLVQGQLESNRIQAEPRFYSTNPSVLLQLAAQGKGPTALPYRLVEAELGKSLVELSLKKPLVRPVIAVWQQGRKLPKSVEDFLDTLEIQLV